MAAVPHPRPVPGRSYESPRAQRVHPLSPALVVHGLRAAEALALALVGAAAWWAHPDLPAPSARAGAGGVFAVLCAAWLMERSGAYDYDYALAARTRLSRPLVAWSTAFAALIVVAYGLKVSTAYPRLWLAVWFGGGVLALVMLRMTWAAWTRQLVRTARLAVRTVVVGTTEHGQRLARHLDGAPDIRTRVIGFVDDGDSTEPSHVGRHPVLGGLDCLTRMIRRNQVDQVILALPWSERDRILTVLAALAQLPVDIRLAPELLRFDFLRQRAEVVAGLPLLRVLDRPVSGTAALIKAVEDRVLCGLALLALAPVMAATALAVRLDSPGPIFFRQVRLGFNNQPIRVWKFRSMYHHMTDANAATLTQRGDPRITRVGHFLRRSSLDELPQLFNVMTGDMSLVGPRPHALLAKAGDQLYHDVVSNYAARHRVKPGLTGWAQVNGWRGETDTSDKLVHRVEHDLHYIEHWSLWLDLRILARTVWVVLAQRNAF